ncbi:TonB-dependent receptor [Teredinibacter haidensis]|uniref:TonB-dependent receptor n=1 Tax=Teredinibacter haidensis TaxID=2731755 RepID=UPI000948DEFE|nr:TonB-dependent receptor [Teredinibacter haidensis]
MPASIARLLKVAAIIMGATFSNALFAQLEPQIYELNIAAQRTDKALIQLGQATQTSVIFDFDIVSRHQSPALKGLYSLEAAAEVLVQNTPLSFEKNDGYIVVKATNPTLGTNEFARLPHTPNKDNVEEEIITIGYFNSVQRSLRAKRQAGSIIDIVVSEDLGKYPDQNVAEALQRVTGISIDRNGGEGQLVTVRGFGPEFNTVLYNGRVLATENEGREFSFDVLASELISGARAYKSYNATLPSGGIGSTIDLVSTKPLDFEGIRSGFFIKSTFDSLADTLSPHYSGLVSYSNDQFGTLISLNHEQRDYLFHSAVTEGWLIRDLSYVADKNGTGNYSMARIPRNLDFRIDTGTRTRTSGTISTQLRPNNNLLFTADALYAEFNVKSNITSSANWTHDYGETIASATLDDNNTLLSYSYKENLALAGDFVQLTRNRPTQTMLLGMNTLWHVNTWLTTNIDLSYSSARNDNGGNDEFVVAGVPNANPSYAYHQGENYPSIVHSRQSSVGDLRSHAIYFEGDDSRDTVKQLKIDFIQSSNLELIDEFEYGIFTSTRTKQKSNFKSPSGGEFSGYQFDLPDNLFSTLDASDFLEGNAPVTWFTFDTTEYVNYLWSDSHIQTAIKDTAHPLADTIDEAKAYGGSTALYKPVDSWKIKERPLEAYVQLNLSNEFRGMPWTANIGLRHSQTHITASGFQQDAIDIVHDETDPTNLNLIISDPIPVIAKNRYDHLLPALNVKLNLTEDKILRLALSRTITRPSLNRLRPTLGDYNLRVGATQASRGNPKLSAYEALNADLSWSWYYGKKHHVGINLFYKDVDNFISETTQVESLLNHEEGNFVVSIPQNAESAALAGLELSLLHTFNNGFGLQANYTSVEGIGEKSTGEDQLDFTLEGMSDTYNIIAFYERGHFHSRLAYNFRDDFLRAAISTQSQPETVEAFGQLDVSAAWQFHPNLELVFEGINITHSKLRTYSVFRERLLEYEDTGIRYSVGIRGRF